MRQERVLVLQGWLFDEGADSYPDISANSIPPNPTCCGNNTAGAAFTSNGQALVTVNGGHAPVIHMRSGEWQRWQLVYAAYMRYVDLALEPASAAAAAADSDQQQEPGTATCELALLGKDGIWLMQIPRSVPHLLLPAGGRADVLVRCRGLPGAEAVLSSGFGPMSQPPHMCVVPSCTVITQPVVARNEACTPLRGSYVADLRDSALAAAGATNKAELLPAAGRTVVRDTVIFSPVDPKIPSEDCFVNGKPFSLPDPAPLRVPLGSVMEWTLGVPSASADNLARWAQLTPYFQVGDWHDVVFLPADAPAGGAAAVRFQPGPWSGYSVHHCHFLMHEDTGCMKVVKWECPGSPGDRQPGVCCSWEPPVPGTY
ncbi:hypothetical protein CHLNCDRAFT_139836 [Chlorella variabilis]|uniref:Uncharacterized protein n=1 Tax=Chlorella variabilis TaxID=554065 RepID=E1ZR14_CHLVA|nr:hypothetical protein CHLNCDRAFT_139836 [Chlorella variabilis]EFN51649.1 hypothetical protein CHLNCDRAFT_139836 [Chlorella variabilis]|eukprot:XP_005843751.1 hypothetical protein CHLNCDRAFT_139836 [Chlorella variabilis]